MSVVRNKPPRLEFDLIEEELLEKVVGEYDVGMLLGAIPLIVEGDRIILLSDISSTSRKLALRTEAGRFFLKQVPWYCDAPPRIHFVHALMTHLSASGLPVPRLLRTRSGGSWVEVCGARFTLSEYVPGQAYLGRAWQDSAAANALACMHTAAADFNPGPFRHVEDLNTIVSSHVVLALERAEECGGNSEAIEWVAEKCIDLFGKLRVTRLTPVHGDFIPWNLAFNGDSIAAIYDFDNSCLDSRLHDIGEAIVGFFGLDYAGSSSRLTSSGWIVPAAERVRAFLNSYEVVAPLCVEERELLALYVLGSWWECLLLAFIRGERAPEKIGDVRRLPNLVRRLWQELDLECPFLDDM